jgi:hypothetical protein
VRTRNDVKLPLDSIETPVADGGSPREELIDREQNQRTWSTFGMALVGHAAGGCLAIAVDHAVGSGRFSRSGAVVVAVPVQAPTPAGTCEAAATADPP